MRYPLHMAESANAFEPEDQDAKERAIAEARAQLAAGRSIPHDKVRRWLLSWGTEDEQQPPPCE